MSSYQHVSHETYPPPGKHPSHLIYPIFFFFFFFLDCPDSFLTILSLFCILRSDFKLIRSFFWFAGYSQPYPAPPQPGFVGPQPPGVYPPPPPGYQGYFNDDYMRPPPPPPPPSEVYYHHHHHHGHHGEDSCLSFLRGWYASRSHDLIFKNLGFLEYKFGII